MFVVLAATAFVVSGCEACTTDVDLVGPIKASGAVGQPVAFDLTGAGWNSPSLFGLCPTLVRVYDGARVVEEHPIDAVRRGQNDCDVTGPGTRFTVDVPGTAVAGTVRLTVELYRMIEGHVPGVGQTTENNRLAIRARREVAVDIASSPPGNTPPTADFTVSPASPSAGRDVRLDSGLSSDAEGPIASRAWDLDGDGSYETAADAPTLATRFDSPGSRVVGLRVVDTEGAVGTMTRMVDVKAPAGPDVAFTWSPDPAKRNQPVAFDASGTVDPDGDAVTSYTWTWGDGTDEETETDPQKTKTYETAGTYTVKLTATDETGATSSRTARIEVQEADFSRAAHAAQARRRRALVAPFELGVISRVVSTGSVTRFGATVHVRGLVAAGTAAGSLPRRLERRAPAGLRAFRDLRWVGRLDGSGPLADLTRVSGSGIVLAASDRSPADDRVHAPERRPGSRPLPRPRRHRHGTAAARIGQLRPPRHDRRPDRTATRPASVVPGDSARRSAGRPRGDCRRRCRGVSHLVPRTRLASDAMRVTMLDGGAFTAAAGIWRRDDDMDRQVRFPVPAYLIETETERILVDTGLHPAAPPTRRATTAPRRSACSGSSRSGASPIRSICHRHDGGPDPPALRPRRRARAAPAGVPVVVQRREWEAAHDAAAVQRNFLLPLDYATIGDQVVLVDGDHDLLGDGSVELLPRPATRRGTSRSASASGSSSAAT